MTERFALLDLVDDVVRHLGLQAVILAGVAVAAIHHKARAADPPFSSASSASDTLTES